MDQASMAATVFGHAEGIIPLMAVVQQNKKKIRPVLDYRELNQFVSSHTAESTIRNDKVRSWRRMGTNLCMIDLKNAYLQIHVHPSLWKF